jgi:hypothetical protein
VEVFEVKVFGTPRNALVTSNGPVTLGKYQDKSGISVNTQIIPDDHSGYLTPQPGNGTPSSFWIVDNAIAHSHSGAVEKSSVSFIGLYVQDCKTGLWVDTKQTLYAPSSPVLSVSNGGYFLSHSYSNTTTGTLLDPRFNCERDPPENTQILYKGAPLTTMAAGNTHFAYVIQQK